MTPPVQGFDRVAVYARLARILKDRGGSGRIDGGRVEGGGVRLMWVHPQRWCCEIGLGHVGSIGAVWVVCAVVYGVGLPPHRVLGQLFLSLYWYVPVELYVLCQRFVVFYY